MTKHDIRGLYVGILNLRYSKVPEYISVSLSLSLSKPG